MTQDMTVTSTTGTSAAATAGSTDSGAALSSLTGNFSDFLNLLMTQLQNQDPTSPMDTNQFTSQLVQFASVEQQINTNTNLTTLINATQSGTLSQASSLVGDTVQVQSDKLSLQNGTSSVAFSATQPATVTVSSSSGTVLRTATVAAGSGGWTWDGKDASGTTLPDGVYGVAVQGADGSAVPFTVAGTATGAQRSGNSVSLSMGALTVDYGALQSVAK